MLAWTAENSLVTTLTSPLGAQGMSAHVWFVANISAMMISNLRSASMAILSLLSLTPHPSALTQWPVLGPLVNWMIHPSENLFAGAGGLHQPWSEPGRGWGPGQPAQWTREHWVVHCGHTRSSRPLSLQPKVSIQHPLCAVCTLYCPGYTAAPPSSMLQSVLAVYTDIQESWDGTSDYKEAQWKGRDHSFIADENQTPLFPRTISNVIRTNINLKSSAFWRESNLFLNDPYFLLAGVLTVSIDFQSTGFF